MNRSEYNKKLHELVKQFSQGYQEQAKQLSDELLKQLDQGIPVEKALTQALKTVPLLDTMKSSIIETVFTAACYGFGIMPKMAANPDAIQKVVTDVPWSMDGVPLSDRLHGAGNTMRQEIESTLKQAFKNQKTFTEAARNLYDGYGYGHVTNKVPLPDYILNVQRNAKRVAAGDQEAYWDFLKDLKKATKQLEGLAQNGAPTRALKAGYQEFLRSVQKLTQKGIEKAVHIAVEEKSRYIAERISRTESARRYYQGERARYDNDPQVVAYKWTLSSRHAQLPYDICDMYANADLYGLGTGIYPKDKLPQIPVHPHCMCSFVPVFVGSMQNSKRLEFSTVNAAKFRPNAVNDFLKHIPYSKSRALLGADGWQKWRITGEWKDALKGWPGISNTANPLKPDWFKLQRFASNRSFVKTENILPFDKVNFIIPESKISGYSLNMDHGQGKNKAIVFRDQLGYTKDNYRELITEIRKRVKDAHPTYKYTDEYGDRFEIIMDFVGLEGQSVPVKTGWIVEETGKTRLVSAYVDRKKKSK